MINGNCTVPGEVPGEVGGALAKVIMLKGKYEAKLGFLEGWGGGGG